VIPKWRLKKKKTESCSFY